MGPGQFVLRTYPQMAQVARPVSGSTSRKLGQPLVPQKMRVAAFARRRMRRMAEARPVTDDVAERDNMCFLDLCFLARRHRGIGDRLRVRVTLPGLYSAGNVVLEMSARRAGSVCWAL